MQITNTDLTTLTFTLINDTTTSQKVFDVVVTNQDGSTTTYLVLVNIGKSSNDTDGNGTIDTLDAKFTLSIINSDGTEVLLNGSPIKLTQVHSYNIEAVTDSNVIVDWISGKCADLIPTLINKKSALAAWSVI